MAVAVAKAPDHYRDDPKIAANLTALTGYLSSHFEAQPLLNKVVALWASNWFPGIITGRSAPNCWTTSTRGSVQMADGA
jgi:hypothetical protein